MTRLSDRLLLQTLEEGFYALIDEGSGSEILLDQEAAYRLQQALTYHLTDGAEHLVSLRVGTPELLIWGAAADKRGVDLEAWAYGVLSATAIVTE